MRILQINSVYGHGSTGKIARSIHLLAESSGHDITTVYGRKKDVSNESVRFFGSYLSMFFHMVLTTLGYHGLGSTHRTLRMLQNMDANPPDLVQLHNLHGYYINYEILFDFIKKWNVPVVWTLHDTWAFTGHCAHYLHVGCDKWKTGCHHCPQKNKYPFSFLVDRSQENYALKKKLFSGIKNLHIITPSEWLSSQVKSSFLKNSSILKIPNGIDLRIFKPVKTIPNEKFTILGIARPFTKKKGLQMFIELSRKLDPDEQIVLVGLTKTQLLRLPKNIIGIPYTNSVEEIVELYSKADVFLNPSMEENFPTTHLEALACGTPVVTFRTGGSGEMLNEMTGIVVEDYEVDSFMNALYEVKSKGKIHYHSYCLQQSKLFQAQDSYRRYIDLYESIVE